MDGSTTKARDMTYSKEQQLKRPDKKVKTSKPKIRTCKTCKTKFEQVRSNMIVCSPKCAYEYSKKQTERKKKQAKILERKRIREENEKNKSLSELKSDLQDIINWIVKFLDKEYPCIARPGEATLRYDAGHFQPISTHPSIRFHLDNIHKQSSQSNKFKNGDYHHYRVGLIKRYGEDYVNYVEGLRLKYPTLKATEHEVRTWIKTAKKIRTRLKKGEVMTREIINKELNIYK